MGKTHPHISPIGLLLASSVLCLPFNQAHAGQSDTQGTAMTAAIGVAAQRTPNWLGANSDQWQPLPFFDIEKPGVGELSSTDGLTLHLPHQGPWEFGIHGDYLWGRSHSDMGAALSGKIPSLSPRVHGGVYTEYQFSQHTALGAKLSHDFTGSGAYLNLYLDYDLPTIWYIEHSLTIDWRAMNRSAMQRFFGLSASSAAALGTSQWNPGSGSQQVSLNYSVFLPTSQHTGIAASLEYARLLGNAAQSPLITQYGSRNQLEQSIAFIYHF